MVIQGEPTNSVADQAALQALFPHTYGKPIVSFQSGTNPGFNGKILRLGAILSGGQAPGGHNVLSGLFDGLKNSNPASRLFGFLGGPAGIMKAQYIEIDQNLIDQYRNTGGFDIIGSGRDKIETPAQFEAALQSARNLELDAVVVIGGDDSNTNAALLAEFFLAQGSDIKVIGVPKTIDGDLKNQYIETSFGFDTACKTYSELIGNICRDANSAKKYWHFIKLMGRSASHITLECALLTQPNIALISEEVAQKKISLSQIVSTIANAVAKRAEKGLQHGIVLIPEGLIEFIPEIKLLIAELNDLLVHHPDLAEADLPKKLSTVSASAYAALPASIRSQLMLDRDPHGNVQVSLIETEKLLMELVKDKLASMKATGTYKGKFSPLAHFFGYEGRCAFPSNFDSDYCYSLGYTACMLVANGFTGYLSSVRNLAGSAKNWTAGGIPLTMMMNMEQRHGSQKPVIRKALVEIKGPAFKAFEAMREVWAIETSYLFPGAIQYWGPSEVCDQPSETLKLEASLR